MSLHVKSTSPAFLPSSSLMKGVARGHLFDSQPLSSSNNSDLVAVNMAHYNNQQHTSGEEQIVKGDTQNLRSIVSSESPAQNSVAWNSVLEHTRNNFTEHRETDTISALFPSFLRQEGVMGVSQIQQPTGSTQQVSVQQAQQQQQVENNVDNITSHQPTSTFLATEAGEGSIINDSLSWGSRGLFTTPSTSPLFQESHPKPAEPALGLMTGRGSLHETYYLQQQQYQQQHSSFTLLSQQQQRQQQNRPPIQQHTATAAEIALGLPSSSFSQDPVMGDGRNHFVPRHSFDQIVESKQDSKSTDSSNSSVRAKNGEEETSRTEDTIAATSSGRLTPLQDSSETDPHRLAMIVGTPSTVSTAPSSDDASLGTDYKLDESILTNLLHPLGQHRRADSWGEEGLLPSSAGLITPPRQFDSDFSHTNKNLWQSSSPAPLQPPQHSQQRPLGDGLQPTLSYQYTTHPPQQQRVATFRNEGAWGKYGTTTAQHLPPQQLTGMNNSQYSHQHVVGYPRQQPPQAASQQQQPPQTNQQLPMVARKLSYAHQAAHSPASHHVPHGMTPPASTPPKILRQQRPGARQTPTVSPTAGQHQSSTNARSASEILKTLLRKKACLYEPDTSRSVALITWLVGRELALEYGFFSRQQLQSGVHACVASKIEAGTITRTKVNRCMQIILNSCFHYIIPRSDGTEENGDHFRALFAATVQDDSAMLQYLPEPWNDLQIDRQTILDAALHESDEKATNSSGKSPSVTPKSSPKIVSVNAEKSPDRDSHDGDKDDSKRAVLLCFNENVRCAEDVFRCHNEFIRDTGNAAHLQLTAQEWRQFFGRESSRAPYLWGSVGIPTLTGESATGPPRRPDLLGQMSKEELAQFRGSWCTKRYEHDHDLCGFAHVDVNGGWLRRNPLIYAYKDEMCRFVSTAGDKLIGPNRFFLNECPKGVHCDFAHSMEEIVYHPNRYKTKVCSSLYSQSRGCRFGDVCPNLHPPDVTKPMRKAEMMRSQGGRRSKHEQSNASAKSSVTLPTGSPVVYASPAPFSSFDQLLGMPGLQSIYRRQSAVIRAFVRSGGKAKCLYSPFGDDWGLPAPVATPNSEGEKVHRRGNSS